MLAKRAVHKYADNLWPFLMSDRRLSSHDAAELVELLDSGRLRLDGPREGLNGDGRIAEAVGTLSKNGFLEFVVAGTDAMVLVPCSREFQPVPIPRVRDGIWRVSRFAYSQYESGEQIVRSPLSDCFLKVRAEEIAAFLNVLRNPTDIADELERFGDGDEGSAVCGALARAGVMLRCDADGKTIDDTDPSRRQWAFHDLVFHSLSRMGRTEKEIGGTFRFKGELPPTPAIKRHPWTETVLPLPRADIAAHAIRRPPDGRHRVPPLDPQPQHRAALEATARRVPLPRRPRPQSIRQRARRVQQPPLPERRRVCTNPSSTSRSRPASTSPGASTITTRSPTRSA